jgi:hypothetical protein
MISRPARVDVREDHPLAVRGERLVGGQRQQEAPLKGLAVGIATGGHRPFPRRRGFDFCSCGVSVGDGHTEILAQVSKW